jgi:hypothetical protein
MPADPTLAEFCLYDVSVTVDSELEAFTKYVRQVAVPVSRPQTPSLRVRSRLQWVEDSGPQSADPESAFPGSRWTVRPDRDLYLGAGEAQWLRIDDFPALQLGMRWCEGELELTGRYHFRIGGTGGDWTERMRRLRYRNRLDRLRAHRFSTLLYYLVYHPILWWLSRHRRFHLLHAGAVKMADGAIVLTGMPGCGKSTLAVALLADPRRFMLSDNLLLHDRQSVLACPELLLLDSASLERATPGVSRLVAAGDRRVYARDAYRPDVTVMEPTKPVALFNLSRGHRTECKRLDPARAANILETNNLMAKEVRRARIMARVLDCVANTEAPDENADLRAMLGHLPRYGLSIAPDEPLERIIDDHILRAVPERTAGEDGKVREFLQ